MAGESGRVVGRVVGWVGCAEALVVGPSFTHLMVPRTHPPMVGRGVVCRLLSPAKRRLDKDIPALARRKLKKQMHKLKQVLPDFDLRRAIQLKNAATKLGLWNYTGDSR